jgi:hypothetical protein
MKGQHNQDSSRSALSSRMGSIDCPETSVTNFQLMLCNTPEERRTNQAHGVHIRVTCSLNRPNNLFTSKLGLNLRQRVAKCYFWSISFYGAETWTLQKVDQKYLEIFEMWCWRRKEKISWTDHVRNEEALHKSQGREKYHTYNK